MTGRPSDYNPEIAAEICAQLADGKSLRAICRQDAMPSMTSVFRWLGHKDKEGDNSFALFREQYARAREAGADAMADDAVDIADNPDIDPNHKRIMVDTRKWFTSKLKPKKYGDKVAIGGDEDAGPIQVSWAK